MLAALIEVIKVLFFKRAPASPPPAPSPLITTASPNDVLILEAQKWVGVIEKGGDNCGPEVEMFQRALNGKAEREPWCAAFMMFCIKQVEERLNVKSAIYKSELVLDVWNRSPVRLRKDHPRPGHLILWRHEGTGTGHMGIIEALPEKGLLRTIEGNTGPGSNVTREGDGVYRKIRSIYGTQTMPVLGFLEVF